LGSYPFGFLVLLIFVLAFLNLADRVSNSLIIFVVIIWFIGHFILIQLRNNDIAPELKAKLWQSGQGIILGNWSLYLAPSNKNPESSFNATKEVYFPDEKRKRINLFLKNIFFCILFIVLLTISYLLLKIFK